MRSHCLETLDIQTLSNHLVFCIVIHEHHLSSSGSLVFSKSLHMDSVLSSIPCVKANRYFISYSHGHLDYISKERDITEECPGFVLSYTNLVYSSLVIIQHSQKQYSAMHVLITCSGCYATQCLLNQSQFLL